MRANELRIGNFTYKMLNSGNGRKIESNINTHDLLRIEEERLFIYEPIPLTEEWLLKFGFDNKFNKGKISIIPKGKLGYENGRTYFNSWAILEKQPDYVHQLQNLYFSLTGEELIIK